MRRINRPVCPNPTALERDYKNPENKDALKKASNGKCMYCESKISHDQYGDVEHIKPKSKYTHLKFQWDNLGYVCTICNRRYKKDKYEESTPYIDPYKEDPNKFIVFSGPMIMAKQGSERGKLSILDIGLNRDSLIEKRLDRIDKISKSIESCFRTSNQILRKNALDELKKEAENDKEYSLCIEYLLKIHNII